MTTFSRREMIKIGGALTLAPATLWGTSTAHGAAETELVDGPPPLPGEGAFCVAVLPDTQLYSERYPDQFIAQTEWLVAQQKARNIACVLHLGDITNHNTPREWENATEALHRLDGKLPYFMALGNHDYSEGGRCKDRTTRFNEYFPLAKYEQLPNFGGVYDKEPRRLENNYHFLTAGGREFLVLALEFGPRADVIRWANDVVTQHKNHEVILITHAYMYYDETRYDWAKHGRKQSWNPHNYGVANATDDDVHDGEELWRDLVSRHDNFIMTLNGHVLNDGLGRLTSSTPSGQDVHQMLVNFQMKPRGGDGWLRLMEFSADQTKVQVADYSPTLDKWNRSAANSFSLPL